MDYILRGVVEGLVVLFIVIPGTIYGVSILWSLIEGRRIDAKRHRYYREMIDKLGEQLVEEIHTGPTIYEGDDDEHTG